MHRPWFPEQFAMAQAEARLRKSRVSGPVDSETSLTSPSCGRTDSPAETDATFQRAGEKLDCEVEPSN